MWRECGGVGERVVMWRGCGGEGERVVSGGGEDPERFPWLGGEQRVLPDHLV